MSTHSVVGILKRNNIQLIGSYGLESVSCQAVYVHCNGYIYGVGEKLYYHYNSSEKAKALVSLGDLSCIKEQLAPRPNQIHSFSNPAKYVTIAYHRDRGEPFHDIRLSATGPNAVQKIIRMLSESAFADYVYVYDEEKEDWFVCATSYFLEEEKRPGKKPLELYPVRDWF